MIKVKFTTAYPYWPFARQTPGQSARWGDYQFIIDQDIDECDWWVVFEGLLKEEKTRCPKNNIILITGEPASIKFYQKKYTDQFSQIVTCNSSIKHPNIFHHAQLHPWMVGVGFIPGVKGKFKSPITKDYDELKNLGSIPKTKLLSVISSNKISTPGHRLRLAFAEKLSAYFGDRIDIFGRDGNEIADKWDAIAPYKYHISIENDNINDWWTEKLADAFLALTYPFFYGCPNIERYFPAASLTKIDISKPDVAIKIIKTAIENNVYEKSTDQLLAAKNLILDKYNLFPFIAELCKNAHSTTREEITLKPEKNFVTLMHRFREKINLA